MHDKGRPARGGPVDLRKGNACALPHQPYSPPSAPRPLRRPIPRWGWAAVGAKHDGARSSRQTGVAMGVAAPAAPVILVLLDTAEPIAVVLDQRGVCAD